MKMKSNQLIGDLIELTEKNLDTAMFLSKNNIENLNWKKDADSWSALQCIEHLNRYGDFYIPEITESIIKSKPTPDINFNSGFFGNRFAKSMLPGEKMKKMKTFKDKRPSVGDLKKDILEEFIEQQQRLLSLLEKAKRVNLNKTRVPISIAKWLKLKLGDVLRVVIYHNQRHLLQASQVLKDSLPHKGVLRFDSLSD